MILKFLSTSVTFVGVCFRKKDHPKLYLWSKEWKESDEESKPKEAAAASVEAVVAPLATPRLDELAAVASFEPIASTSACGQTTVDDVDLHPALKLPLSAMEMEHLATTMAQSIPITGVATQFHSKIHLFTIFWDHIYISL